MSPRVCGIYRITFEHDVEKWIGETNTEAQKYTFHSQFTGQCMQPNTGMAGEKREGGI